MVQALRKESSLSPEQSSRFFIWKIFEIITGRVGGFLCYDIYMKSKIGLTLAGIFVIITLILDIQAINCGGMFCGLGAIFPALPWVAIPWIPGDYMWWIYFSQLINAVIIYFIGVGISKFINK